MKQKLFNKEKYKKCCANCYHGRLPKDKMSVLCEKKGVMRPEDSCSSYKYDPLKRIPQKLVLKNNYTEDDFKI